MELSVPARARSTAEPVPISGMADLLGMDRTTLTRNLRPLEALELVVIQPDERDRRVRCLALTAKGQELLKEAVPLWRKAQGESNRRIGPNRWGEPRPSLGYPLWGMSDTEK